MLKIFNNYFEKPGLLGLLLAIYLINPFNLGFLFGYSIFAILILKSKFLKENIDKDFILLTIFSFIYSLFYALDPEFGIQYILIYAVFPQTFYLLGKYLCSKSTDENVILRSIFTVGLLLSFPGITAVSVNILEHGFGQVNRSLPLIWSDDPVSATLMGSFFTLNMCIPSLLVVNQVKYTVTKKLFMALIFLISLACVLRIGTRTQIVISLIALATSLFYIVPKQSLKKNLIIFATFIIFIFIVVQNVNFDVNSDWLAAFTDRMDNNSGADIASGGGRTSRWMKSLENLFEKPLGWQLQEFGYSHNLWLDVLRASGVIPFILLLIFTIRSIIKVRRITKLNYEMLSFFNQIRVYTLALLLLFMVEPIFEGMFTSFVVFCLLMGVIAKFESRYTKVIRMRQENTEIVNSELVK